MNFFPNIRMLEPGPDADYHIDLLYQDNQEMKLPVITFVTEQQVPVNDVDDFGVSGGDLVRIAFQKLRELELDWEKSINLEHGCLLIENVKYASEKVLDKDLLIKVAQKFNTTQLLVSIPVRNSLLICDALNREGKTQLERKVQQLFSDFSREQISPLVFRVENGALKGVQAVETKMSAIEPMRDFPPSYACSPSKLTLFGAMYNVKMMPEANNIEELKKGMFMNIYNILLEHLRQKDFTRTIEIQSAFEQPPKTPENESDIITFLNGLNENPLLQALLKSSEEPVKVSFLFGADFSRGDTHKKIITNLFHKK